RLFLYKTDCVSALMELFDSPLQTAEIAGPKWLTIREVAEEVAAQLNVGVVLGKVKGSEVPIDPTELLPNWRPQVSLSEGLAHVISDAREYLSIEQGAGKTSK